MEFFHKWKNKRFGTRYVLCENMAGYCEVTKLYKNESGLYVKSPTGHFMLLTSGGVNAPARFGGDPINWIRHIGKVLDSELYTSS
jgi:hypothetical protein